MARHAAASRGGGMIRSVLRHTLEVIAGLMALVLVLAAAAIWLLASGPVDVSRYDGAIEDLINRQFTDGADVSIAGTSVMWLREERALVLDFENVRMRDDSGELVARVPELQAQISLSGLLRGVATPSRLTMTGAAAIVIRRADGGLQFGLARAGEARGGGEAALGPDLGVLLAMLAHEPDASQPLSYLKELKIRRASLVFFDAATGAFWRAPRASLTFTKMPPGLAVDMDVDVDVAGQPWRITASGAYDGATGAAELITDFTEVRPAAIAATMPALRALRQVDVPVSGAAAISIGAGGAVRAAELSLKMGDGSFGVPGFTEVPIPMVEGELEGVYVPATNELNITRLRYTGADNSAEYTGTFRVISPTGSPWDINELHFDVVGEDVVINVPGYSERSATFDRLALKGALVAGSTRRMTLDLIEMTAADMRITLTGYIGDVAGSPEVDLEGTLDGIPVDELLTYWPLGVASGARSWIDRNMRGGLIHDGQFRMEAPAGALDDGHVPDEMLRLEFGIRGTSAIYIQELPPMTGASGRAVLTGNQFRISDVEAAIGGIRLTRGSMVTGPLDDPGAPATFALTLDGGADEMLALLDMGPFGYPSRYGIDPQAAGGNATLRIDLSLPLTQDIPIEQINVGAQARLRDFSLPELFPGMDLAGGIFEIRVNNNGLDADGSVRLNALPATIQWTEDFSGARPLPTRLAVQATLDDEHREAFGVPLAKMVRGPMGARLVVEGHGGDVRRATLDVDLTTAEMGFGGDGWSKPVGEEAMARFRLEIGRDGAYQVRDVTMKGPDLEVSGSFSLAPDGRILDAEFPSLAVGDLADVTLTARRTGEEEALRVDIAGRIIDLSAFLGDLLPGEAEPTRTTPYHIIANIDRVMLRGRTPLDNVEFEVINTGERFAHVSLNGHWDERSVLTASLEGGGEGDRRFSLTSGDAGRLIRGLFNSDEFVGGSLSLTAEIREPPEDEIDPAIVAARDGMPPPAIVAGELVMENYRVVNVPPLARLLTLATLTGFGEMLQGEGIQFTTGRVPFTMSGPILWVQDAHTAGPSIGLTLSGKIDRREDVADLQGTIVPAYAVNTMFGNVPILGDLFVSRQGEGVIGVTYAVSGPADNPRLYVNPLSALAPGFLRRLFQVQEASDAPPLPAPRPNTVPPAAAPPPEESPASPFTPDEEPPVEVTPGE
jgi:hypothetical protein